MRFALARRAWPIEERLVDTWYAMQEMRSSAFPHALRVGVALSGKVQFCSPTTCGLLDGREHLSGLPSRNSNL